MKKAILERKNYPKGFSLLELLVVLTIMGLVLAMAVPRLVAIYDRELLSEQAYIIEEDLRWLKAQARASGEDASFKSQGDGYSLSVKKNGTTESKKRDLLNERMTISASSFGGQIIFKPRGTAYYKCTLTLRLGSQKRTVVVNNLGRVRVGVGKSDQA